MKVTNNSKALQGVYSAKGVIYLKPGETKEITFSDVGARQARRLPFLKLEGSPQRAAVPEVERTPAEVLAMAEDGSVPFMAFKAAAAKLLGAATPTKKDEIVAALVELGNKG
ncbi:hypothetical protein [Aquamicrobium sp. LC103]|uniref:hypothetical protein n=1 Tax=Aquamicrobium sp. LC103 TaxID=1120658 RepID=UPI00063E98CA|nr:hypothetical protein [Aquamicrobium sp. LC103]TKT79981.1 hypothetical protein XW59_006355 [Aquamicrobium sp. LC103]